MNDIEDNFKPEIIQDSSDIASDVKPIVLVNNDISQNPVSQVFDSPNLDLSSYWQTSDSVTDRSNETQFDGLDEFDKLINQIYNKHHISGSNNMINVEPVSDSVPMKQMSYSDIKNPTEKGESFVDDSNIDHPIDTSEYSILKDPVKKSAKLDDKSAVEKSKIIRKTTHNPKKTKSKYSKKKKKKSKNSTKTSNKSPEKKKPTGTFILGDMMFLLFMVALLYAVMLVVYNNFISIV